MKKNFNYDRAFKIIGENLQNLKIKNDLICFVKKYNNYKLTPTETIIQKANILNNKDAFLYFKNVINQLNNDKVNYILLKGPILSFLLHDNQFYRNYCDYDIYISDSNYINAAKILYKIGYKDTYANEFQSNKINNIEKSYLIRGNTHFSNNKSVCLEVKNFILLITNDKFSFLNSHIIHYNFNNVTIKGFDIYGNIIVLLIYLYFSLCTLDGKMYKNYMNYLLEVIILFQKYSNEINYEKLIHLIVNIGISKEINDMNVLLFKLFSIKICHNSLIEGNFNLNKQFYYIKKNDKNFVNCICSLNNIEKNNKIIKKKLLSNYQDRRSCSYEYFLKHENLDEIAVEIRYPRYLDFVVFSIILYIDNVYYRCEVSFYERDIYEINTTINIKYLFRFYSETQRHIIIKFNMHHNKVIYRVEIRKIGKSEYPLMERANSPFYSL